MLEQAENETDPILRKGMLNFVVVGGGYAGIETAGELLDLLFDATKHYPTIQKEDVKVIVLEAMGEILGGANKKLANFAKACRQNQQSVPHCPRAPWSIYSALTSSNG